MVRTQAKFSPEFLSAFKYFQETQNKEGMQAFLESHLKCMLPSRMPKPNSKIVFAFDIDGVLVHGSTPLPGVKTTLEFLQRHKIPFIFLTNGGDATEKDHVALKGNALSITNLSEHQFVQSHSPFKDLVPGLKDKNILILGGVGNKLREVAKSYGFNHVLTSSDICKADPKAYLFTEYTLERHLENGSDIIRRGPNGEIQISAIMVWSSPRDWGLDLQIIMDLLLSEKGVFRTVSPYNGDVKLPNRGYLQDEQPGIYFSNPGLIMATAHCSRHGTVRKIILVESGIHVAGTGPAHEPNIIMKDVKGAVERALWDSKLSDLGHIPDDDAGSGSS